MAKDTRRSVDPGAPDMSPVDARQGRIGTPVLLVLLGGLVLSAVVWAGVEMWGRHINPDKSPTAVPGPGPSSNIATGASQRTAGATLRQGGPALIGPIDRVEKTEKGINSALQYTDHDAVQKEA
ncbi:MULTISPECIES: hypothetical protein [unclassified Rhizobium]|uniref:hypothetical protein n=1 Tax=unclassified Rhizobium TaxID=2613769 RepID=UPI001ADAA428|nr:MULTISPECIES: hypothetical protein [unclassified Rhizobium]MBO9102154.1 hypothetical protein [Rhizobium sp. L58/93]MBO9171914.1 hypothetical protein [Rhizobium sp. L245/93]QXZ87217.1 hypothetical protein J5287_21905 [Rhizobium sp. K1/93]QXZ92750.1 hypothetical protein J5280_18990 [Rhizobium sp. K15/93]QYA04031.1 hypothetical protein J5278_25105 [Rhizobium sp. B21/90]